MKHIFVVHSNITYLSALGVMVFKQLNKDDVLLVSYHYRRTEPVPVVPIQLFSLNLFRPRNFFNFARRTDRLIERFTQGEPFRAYLPAMTKPAKVVATHRLCAGFDFIEEGIGSYLRQFPIENHVYEYRHTPLRASWSRSYFKGLIFSLLNSVRGETPYFSALPINYTSYAGDPAVGFYGFHTSVFPLAPERSVLDFRQIAMRFDLGQAAPTLPDEATILIGEGLFSLTHGYSVAQYLELLAQRVIPWLHRHGVEHLYLKHHYNENTESKTESRALLERSGITLSIIDDSVILETLLPRLTRATLLGYSSSLLFYGGLMGCRAYSYSPSDTIISSVATYWQVVQRIEHEPITE